MATSQPRVTETEYVKILRQKLGEFMLTMIDLHKRGIKNSACVGEEDCIVTLIDALKEEGEAERSPIKTHFKNKSYESINQRLNTHTLVKEDYNLFKQFIVYIINIDTKKYNSEIEQRLLNVLLYNNGFPCRFLTKRNFNNSVDEYNKYLDNTLLYEMYMIIADISGNQSVNQKEKVIHNHYTVEIPDGLQQKLEGKLGTYSVNNEKIQIAGDGDCFYTAVAVWCKIYGITEDHLNSLTINVPFDFSEEHFKRNLKVPTPTDANPIPKPIKFPKENAKNDINEYLKFKTDALIIAQNMKKKITQDDFKPTFENEKNITESKEYEEYDGFTKDNGTHCNKYKGNQETKVEVEY